MPALLPLAAYLAFSLATKNAYHKQYQPGADVFLQVGENPDVQLAVLEFDDDGFPWGQEPRGVFGKSLATSADPVDTVLRQIEDRTRGSGRDTVIAVFAHGWHHNAVKKDADFVAFRDLLATLRKELDGKTPCQNPQVLGVYLAWRGRSSPGFMNYTTFFGRKAAAERVGHGGGADFLLRLHRQVRETNETSPYCTDGAGAHANTSLIIAGHSFGGALVFSAFDTEIQNRLADLDQQARAEDLRYRKPFEGLGDLTILINPAFEAIEYQRLYEHLGNQRSKPEQGPVLLVLASENDVPNQKLFSAAALLSTAFRATTPRGRQLRQALGVFPEHWTHCLEPAGGHRPEGCPAPPGRYSVPWTSGSGRKSTEIELAGDYHFPGVEGGKATFLTRIDPHSDPNAPFLVVRTSRDLLYGHSGRDEPSNLAPKRIFQDNLNSFLLGYITEAVTKKALLGIEHPELRRAQMVATE